MLWELVATVFAGLGAAGIALMLRKISGQKLPRAVVPVFAGLGMLAFQIHGEYNWYSHQLSLLPKDVVVVKAVEEQINWKPWTYLKPQISRFMAVDVKNSAANSNNANLVLANLYLFERRQAAINVKLVIDCQAQKRANFTEQLVLPAPGEASGADFIPINNDEKTLLSVCTTASAANTD
ncbi:hypothetical protein [Rheinheimera sp.]|uniref:hypothetical protein n=1 Tax=Rheinheimera sp. TaxID=1869214 RepID=UPI0027B93D7E|nr:hypothetical protein [Rheinheimera sp.]